MSSTEALIVNFGEKETGYALKIAGLLRRNNIMTEIYPDPVKLKKQLSYADSRKIPYIIMAGEDEIKNNSVTVKVMATGDQQTVALSDIGSYSFLKDA